MYIKFVEIANFRKLLATRIDISEKTTLFVGANNSGKTSALTALRKFLSPRGPRFEVNDFTLCHWTDIISIGQSWIDSRAKEEVLSVDLAAWGNVLPTLDLWLYVEPGELHYVQPLIPTLEWEGGDLGVRLRFQPKDPQGLYREFLAAYDDALAVKAMAVQGEGGNADAASINIWPSNLFDFLSRKLLQHFEIRAYSLNPAALNLPSQLHQAILQALPESSLPLDSNPLAGMIRVNDIQAQRGFGEAQPGDTEDSSATRSGGNRLSDQLRSYYGKHLDPMDRPDPADLGALQAIEAAQNAFDARLTESFKAAFAEVEGLGYPGVSDPRPRVSTKLKPIDGLSHAAAVSFEVDVVSDEGKETPILRLPEDNNGLGYQNLISMIFRLMSFRDAWMRVGKASKEETNTAWEPLHLVLVEEPEAHLHAQVQQVFIKKAYAVLRAHEDLGDKPALRTQLIVSTHSSHVAHETSFASLRYFRRLPAGMGAVIPVSSVVNLSGAFGGEAETERFVIRYLRAQHADLFFADAAILVEGPAERMLVPNFVRSKHPFLNQCYITLLEIGGSHAHRLRPLIDTLGLSTLIITDLDSLNAGGSAVQPAINAGQVTNNATLKGWLPQQSEVDALYGATAAKVSTVDPLFSVRVAYQTPVNVTLPNGHGEETAYPYTFEDALAFENLEFFAELNGTGLVAKFKEALAKDNAKDAGSVMFNALRNGKKAEFALDIIDEERFDTLHVPLYIKEGLEWLEAQLKKRQVDILPTPEGEK